MVRLKLPPDERRNAHVFVNLRPSEKRLVEQVMQEQDGKSRGAVLRNTFLEKYADRLQYTTPDSET